MDPIRIRIRIQIQIQVIYLKLNELLNKAEF